MHLLLYFLMKIHIHPNPKILSEEKCLSSLLYRHMESRKLQLIFTSQRQHEVKQLLLKL